jgi:hypothetical protein
VMHGGAAVSSAETWTVGGRAHNVHSTGRGVVECWFSQMIKIKYSNQKFKFLFGSESAQAGNDFEDCVRQIVRGERYRAPLRCRGGAESFRPNMRRPRGGHPPLHSTRTSRVVTFALDQQPRPLAAQSIRTGWPQLASSRPCS